MFVAAPQKSNTRNSSLLGSIFRRSTTTSAPAAPPRLVGCLTCGADDIPSAKSVKLSCGHRMCYDCLKRIFELSLKDPAHMPPKCCTTDQIPLKYVEKLFGAKFRLLWNRRYQEYKTTKNRIYCPVPRCGHWISPSHIHSDQGRKYARCPRCKTKICVICNNKMHKSRDCPEDPEVAKLIQQMKDKGWQRCYSCHAVVELAEGCNHMSCRCTAQFCMICGSKWKTCDCPWFNHTHVANADRLNEMRVPRRVWLPPPPLPERDQLQPPQGYDRPLQLTYQEEMEQRRRQERLDADLAHRMQLASLMSTDEDDPDNPSRQRAELETLGFGNAVGHFMNQDYAQNAANVVMAAFGDAGFGRRGDRASGRRQRARRNQDSIVADGLSPDFLGDESVLGVGTQIPRSA